MVVAVPVTLLGQTPSAIVHTQGGVWVNGYEARDSSAIFAGDLIETKAGFSANLTLDGSTVLIQPETVGKFQGDVLVLDHGGVSVGTSKSFKVRVNCLTVVPVQTEWTQYEVADINGTVQVAARKNDVNVNRETGVRKSEPATAPEQSNNAAVHEGEQKNYNESSVCGAPAPPAGPTTSLNPKWIGVGAAGAGGLLCLLLCRSGGKTPISPKDP
jgi:hypothetical protein